MLQVFRQFQVQYFYMIMWLQCPSNCWTLDIQSIAKTPIKPYTHLIVHIIVKPLTHLITHNPIELDNSHYVVHSYTQINNHGNSHTNPNPTLHIIIKDQMQLTRHLTT